ncbi:GNAT family N-acetyltransferase [Ornithinimicrobium sufpigmenti]|uniref:GNAT family N-acetyltransferase n=1 Tax=Ornithinimicrobium sufpigmenti TaxID=2508882 RepID=UPI001036ACFF|nr:MULTISPECIES: GNAT family N-acetyltransferase [unclassified Ornithinimicrobium]
MITSERDPDRLQALHARFIVPHFPPEERGTAQELVQSAATGRSIVFTAGPDGDTSGPPTGLAVVDTWPEVPQVALLAWLAVSTDTRSRGTGSTLLRHVLHHLGRRILLAEIEPADTVARSRAYGDPRARAGFYARHGARRLNIPYWQPPTYPGGPPVLLDLVVVPRPGTSVPALLPAEPVRSFLQTYALPYLPTDLADSLDEALTAFRLRTSPLG